MNIEQERASTDCDGPIQPWRKWGPYVSERSWGTVREDYGGPGNDVWTDTTFEGAIEKAYRWGEDGIAGICDRYQVLCFAPLFWNGNDPILKERLFGLSPREGNHGEDVKECYYHLDATPSHSYLKYLYKYPHKTFPYQELIDENQRRGLEDPEYELIDTGIFEEGRYFDIFIEYAKADKEDICIKIEAFNRGKEEAPLHIAPQLWFRNQWSWTDEEMPRPTITKGEGKEALVADDSNMFSPADLPFDYHLNKRYFYASEGGKTLFTENDTKEEKAGFYKDAFHGAIMRGESTVNPENKGTKAAIHYHFETVKPGESVTLYFRLTDAPKDNALDDIEAIFKVRIDEANTFYNDIHPKQASEEEKKIQRQALAGMVWSKQIYLFNVEKWIKGEKKKAPPMTHAREKNAHWLHLNSMRILLMPDKWEYPWFAAWDQAFHTVAFSLIDIDFAKEQLWHLLFDQFQHPNGQIPAYEWDYSDLNPPVQGWAALQLYEQEKRKRGKGDKLFLKKVFHKLLINFAWWVNKVDASGNNVFEGGFLGLDNITVIDRSQKFADGAILQQSDGTGWMGMFCLNLMRMALELAKDDTAYESLATKFFQHFVYISHAMKVMGDRNYNLWSEEDGFFYDVLSYPDGRYDKFQVRSLVGIIPAFAIETLELDEIKNLPEFYRDFSWFTTKRSDLTNDCVHPVGEDRFVLSLVNKEQLTSILKYARDEKEFYSEFGLRSLSKYHENHPFVYEDKQVGYEPAESRHLVMGGNSNWRGPIWFPTTYLFIQSMSHFAQGYKEELDLNFKGLTRDFSEGLMRIFKRNHQGRRPVFGENFPYHDDPHWSEHIFFHEYFNAETGKGIGSSHQTGWTGLIANVIDNLYRDK